MDAVPLDDRGLLLADGLFETLLWRDGALMFGEAHWARMAAGAQALGLPPPTRAAFEARAAHAVRDAGLADGRAAVRVTLTAGSGGRGLDRPATLQPRLFSTASASPRPAGPASLAYLDNVLARRGARDAGADEAVMLNTSGELTCAAAANLWWIEAGALATPADATGCLPGIMAAQVRAAAHALGAPVREAREGQGALERAEAIFLTSSLIGVRPAHLLGRGFATHPLVDGLAQAVDAFT